METRRRDKTERQDGETRRRDETERRDGETRWRDETERLVESEGRRTGKGWVQEAQRVGWERLGTVRRRSGWAMGSLGLDGWGGRLDGGENDVCRGKGEGGGAILWP